MVTDESPTIKKFDNGSFVITTTIPSSDIAPEIDRQLTKLQKHFDYKGFRTGTVPLGIIKDNIDQDKLLEEVATQLITNHYQKIATQNQLKPIINPRATVKNLPLTTDKDWQVEIESTQTPPIKIDSKLINKIKKLKKKDLNIILKLVIESSQLELPKILLETELQQKLQSLFDNLQKAKISLEKYLEYKKVTQENLIKLLTDEIAQEWTLNLAINQIAKDQKIDISQKELAQNPHLPKHLQIQKKVIEFLTKL